MSKHKKIHIYAQLMPYSLKMALAFFPEDTINDVQFFIEETMKKFRSKYRIGRIEKKSNSAWLLPQYVSIIVIYIVHVNPLCLENMRVSAGRRGNRRVHL